jgi:hypothetical protein
MSETIPARITSGDLESVAEKLKGLSSTLTPGEQAVLGWLVDRAAEAPENSGEVQGYQGQFSAPASAFQFSPSAHTFQNSLGLSQFSGGLRPGGANSWSVTVGIMG